MNNTLYIVVSAEKVRGGDLQTFVQGVYSTLPLAQQKLQAAIVEDMECNPDAAPFAQQEGTDDICFVDQQGTEYHYNIVQRNLDEV